MKKWIWIGVVAVVVIFFYATYNGFVNKEEGLKTAWSNVETQYQRRADLIPNLVNTVKGYAAHESQTFEAVTEARAKATSINLSADDLTPEKLAEFQQAQAQAHGGDGRQGHDLHGQRYRVEVTAHVLQTGDAGQHPMLGVNLFTRKFEVAEGTDLQFCHGERESTQKPLVHQCGSPV